MITHQLKLATEPFDVIVSGNKTIESRLYDEKRQKIQLGGMSYYYKEICHD
jgi:ASC-1-like (ASCH) protein